MKFSVEQAVLVRELQLLSVVIDRKPTIPILDHVLVSGSPEGGASVAATNLETALITRFAGAVVESAGRAALPAPTLLGLAQRMPSGEVRFDASGDHAAVRQGAIKARVPMMDAEMFPALLDAPDATFTIQAAALAKAVASVRPTMSAPGAKYSVDGAYLHCHEGEMRLVSTDGHRASIAALAIPPVDGVAFQLPTRSWAAVEKWLSGESGETSIAVAAGDDRIWFTSKDRTLFCRRLDLNYPAYWRIYASIGKRAVTVDRSEMQDALRRHIVMALPDKMRTRFSFSETGVALETDTLKGGIEDAASAEGFAGNPLDVILNPKYALDAFDVMESDRVRVTLKDNVSVVHLGPVEGAGPSVVVMPMRD